MTTINFSAPIEIELNSGLTANVNNLLYQTRDLNNFFNNYITSVSVGYFETYNRNAVCEAGTIQYQMVSDVNGDGSPPLVGISATSIFDQDSLITFETYFDRPYSTYTSQNKRTGAPGIPSINLSGAQFDRFQNANTELVVLSTALTPTPLENFPPTGRLQLNKEVVSYTGKSGDTFTGVTRDIDGTGPYTHTSGDYLRSITI